MLITYEGFFYLFLTIFETKYTRFYVVFKIHLKINLMVKNNKKSYINICPI